MLLLDEICLSLEVADKSSSPANQNNKKTSAKRILNCLEICWTMHGH